MPDLTFMSTTGDETVISCKNSDIMKDVCKKYANEIGKRYKQLVFFSNGFKIDKKLTVKEYKQNNPNSPYILVKIMDIDIENDSDEEKKASVNLKKKIIDEIKNQNFNPTYEKMQELVLQYGYDTEKTIQEEIKKNPEYFIKVENAVKLQEKNENLFILGKLGESLESMGIKVAIDKRENLKTDDYLINNQFISSGIIKKNKYEIHIDEKDNLKKHKILHDQNEQKKFIEQWRENISNYILVPKNKVFIANIREGSITMDAIFTNIDSQDIYGKYLNIDERMENFANSYPKIKSIYVKNILGACKLTLDMLDERGNQSPSGWAKPGEKRGGVEYFPPDYNWVGYGLKVWDQYDNKNNDWIGMNGNPNEWAVAYHGTSETAVNSICSRNGKFFSSYKDGGKGQKCKDYDNINILSKHLYPKCGEGTYCSPHLKYAEIYTKGVIIMCRVNPKLMRVPSGKYSRDEWITDGTRNTIRPYRLLYKINK